MLNAGQADAFQLGALGYFSQSEADAGLAAGERLAKDGARHVLCVIHSQGQTQLEARCDGIAKGLGTTGKLDRLYVRGEDPTDVTTKINAALTQDPSVDWIVTLAATHAIQDGKIAWAVDQQPYLQGYLAVDSLWLFKTNGNTIGGGSPPRLVRPSWTRRTSQRSRSSRPTARADGEDRPGMALRGLSTLRP